MVSAPRFDQLVSSSDLTLFDLNCETNEEVIRRLGALLFKNGFVRDDYVEAVLLRESTMPTGLKTKIGGVAIPHTDTEYVHRPAIAIGRLSNPVLFKNMANPKEDVPVDIVFLLAIAQKESVMIVLARLAELFLDEGLLQNLLDKKSAIELSGYFSELITEEQ